MDMLRLPMAPALAFMTCWLALTTQACSSSATVSDAPGSSAPANQSQLRSMLSTGTSSDKVDEFWECATSTGSPTRRYHLWANGTGAMSDVANPALQTRFTWAAISPTAISTSASTAGLPSNLTNIRFTGGDKLRMQADDDLELTCERLADSEGASASNTNVLSYGGIKYELTHGFEEVFSYRPIERNDTHSSRDFSVADTAFSPTTLYVAFNPPQLLWRPDGKVWFQARLFSPDAANFNSATFEYEPDSTPDNSPTLSGSHYFQKARLGMDIDQDGSIDSKNGEFFDVVSGSITVNRVEATQVATMRFRVTLSDGVTVTGEYTGRFIEFENN